MNQLVQWHYRKVLSCCLLYLLTFLQAQGGESIAVLDLEGRGISSFEAASLTDRLRSQLVRTGKVTVVERGQMNQILSEQDFQSTGCTSDECAVEIGQMLGVTSMVAGSIGKIGSTYTIDLRTIDVSTGKITKSIIRDYRGEIDGLIAEMGAVAAELVEITAVEEPITVGPAAQEIFTPPASTQIAARPAPAVQPPEKGGGLKWLVLGALVAGGGAYAITAGGGDTTEPPGNGGGPLTVGNPPVVPSP